MAQPPPIQAMQSPIAQPGFAMPQRPEVQNMPSGSRPPSPPVSAAGGAQAPQEQTNPETGSDPLLSPEMKRILQKMNIDPNGGVQGVLNAYVAAGCPAPSMLFGDYRQKDGRQPTVTELWSAPGVFAALRNPSPEAAWKRMKKGASGGPIDTFLAMQSMNPKIRIAASGVQPGAPAIMKEYPGQQAAGRWGMSWHGGRSGLSYKEWIHNPSTWRDKDPQMAAALEAMAAEKWRREHMPHGRATRRYQW